LASTSWEGDLLARALPKKPFKEQKTQDCSKKRAEVLINGGCWVPVKLPERKAGQPCPNGLYEDKGECYIPVAKPKDAEAAIRR
jgi:hypothetical protein